MLKTINAILSNEVFVRCAMAVIIFLITQVLKMPIKYFTKKIPNERVRKAINATILLIPFVLGCLLELLYDIYYLQTAFSVLTGLGNGTAGITLYAAVERFFGVKQENPYVETEEGQAITDLVEEVTKDGKVDEEDISAVQEFLNKLK